MREIVNLFSERESRDELGVGQVRDALCDALWPGTSMVFLQNVSVRNTERLVALCECRSHCH
jgi:hypothetical protein